MVIKSPESSSISIPAFDRVLRWPDVRQRTGISRSHAYAMAAEGRFPQPIKLGPRASGWLESEIMDWLQSRVDASRP